VCTNNRLLITIYQEKSELLESYDKGVKPLGKILATRFDDKHTNTILIEAREEFEAIIPQLPYIGGSKCFRIWQHIRICTFM